MWSSTITSPSPTPSSFNVFLSSNSGVPLKFKVISFAGNPDSISQNALKFSSSRSSETSSTNISSLSVVTVTFIVLYKFSLDCVTIYRELCVRAGRFVSSVLYFGNDFPKHCTCTQREFNTQAVNLPDEQREQIKLLEQFPEIPKFCFAGGR